MKRTLLFVSFLFFSGIMSIAQTTATDFTSNDCGGTSHHLFAELEAGKIIVMSFVMPCHSCIAPSLSARSTVGTYSSSNPGKVLFYMADDLGNDDCASLSGWCSANGMATGIPTFSNTSIKMTDYGASAMPKIVVLAGADHKVMFVADDILDATLLKKAIDSAIAKSTAVMQSENAAGVLTLLPNPVTNAINVRYLLSSASAVTMDIYDMAGTKVKAISAGSQAAGPHETSLNTGGDLPKGIYMLKLNAGGSSTTIKFNVLN